MLLVCVVDALVSCRTKTGNGFFVEISKCCFFTKKKKSFSFPNLWTTFFSTKMILHKTLVIILASGMSKSSFRCSGSQIEISIMKSVSEDQCEWLLIYNHDDLSDLHIEISLLKKTFFNRIWAENWLLKCALKKSSRKLVRKTKFE